MFLTVQARMDALYETLDRAYDDNTSVEDLVEEITDGLDYLGLSIVGLAEEIAVVLEERGFDAEDAAEDSE